MVEAYVSRLRDYEIPELKLPQLQDFDISCPCATVVKMNILPSQTGS